MKLTKDNISTLDIKENEKKLLKVLLADIDIINIFNNKKLYVDWQDFHTEYSPEWTDPCPDYYGYYTLRFEHKPYEIVGVEMTIDDLDSALCLLIEFMSELNSDITE